MNRRKFIGVGAGAVLSCFFGLPPVPGGDNRRMVAILRKTDLNDIQVLLHKRFEDVVVGDVFKIEGEESLDWFAFKKQLSPKVLIVESLRDRRWRSWCCENASAQRLRALSQWGGVAICTAQQVS